MPADNAAQLPRRYHYHAEPRPEETRRKIFVEESVVRSADRSVGQLGRDPDT